jgi:hypothetical protein
MERKTELRSNQLFKKQTIKKYIYFFIFFRFQTDDPKDVIQMALKEFEILILDVQNFIIDCCDPALEDDLDLLYVSQSLNQCKFSFSGPVSAPSPDSRSAKYRKKLKTLKKSSF